MLINIRVMVCVLLKHIMLRGTLLPTDHLGSDHNAFRQTFHHIPSVSGYMLFQLSHQIDEDCLIFCCCLDCDETVRVYQDFSARCVTLALTRAGTSFDQDDLQSSQSFTGNGSIPSNHWPKRLKWVISELTFAHWFVIGSI